MYRTVITATALSGLMALSANALEIGAGANAGISFDDGIAVSAGVSANADAESASNDTEMTAEDRAKKAADRAGYIVAAESEFIGNTVETMDGVVVGTVTDVYTKPGADSRVRVEFTEAAGIENPDGFWLPLSADAKADGKLVLPMSLAELDADMAAKVESNG